ncbi:MAG: flagellar basal body P-ring protein FlgI [Alphaproteobacteria bacterium]|nr:flagellar basal body P-ring protein FlgI [Alphaproteobacteria bacterium]
MLRQMLVLLFSALMSLQSAQALSRLKDIIDIEGVRDNMLIGYGLVVGLNGTGDSLSNSIFTRESLVGMLERLGVTAQGAGLSTKNVAAVMVTATLPPFARQGSRIDVSVSALGDSKSLLGGTLLVTPLLGADGEVYAVSQGTLIVGGFQAQGAAETIVKGVPTSGRIANGAIVEREIDFDMGSLSSVRLALRNPDLTTAARIKETIDAFVGVPVANVLDPGTVEVRRPAGYNQSMLALLTEIELLRVQPDMVANVVIDEQSGVIVMGENVRINPVAVAQGSLTIRITEQARVSQPQPFSNVGTTEQVLRTEIAINEDTDARLTVVDGGVTLQDLVNGLNALGIGPRDLITILQAIKSAGALNADIRVM